MRDFLDMTGHSITAAQMGAESDPARRSTLLDLGMALLSMQGTGMEPTRWT